MGRRKGPKLAQLLLMVHSFPRPRAIQHKATPLTLVPGEQTLCLLCSQLCSSQKPPTQTSIHVKRETVSSTRLLAWTSSKQTQTSCQDQLVFLSSLLLYKRKNRSSNALAMLAYTSSGANTESVLPRGMRLTCSLPNQIMPVTAL